MARSIISENHTLVPTPVYVAYPILRPCKPCLPGRDRDNEEPLLGDKDASHKQKKQKVDKEQLDQDPFLLLGFGMIAYRDLLLTFVILFSFLSLLMGPAMYYYSKHEGIINPAKYSVWSIGNMGYSTSQCANIPLEVGKLSAQCPFGVIGEIYT